jgi:leucyl-tRNA synthetase
MFTAPPEATLEWNDSAVEGSFRFLRRVWNFAYKHRETLAIGASSSLAAPPYSEGARAMRFDIHTVLRQASFDYERMQYNTVASAVMKMLNTLEAAALGNTPAEQQALAECFSIMLRVLYPACPHITCTLWAELLDAPWPQVDDTALVQDVVVLMLQINGKLRGALQVPADANKADIEAAALSNEAFLKQANGVPAKKVIVVPGRLVNIVV